MDKLKVVKRIEKYEKAYMELKNWELDKDLTNKTLETIKQVNKTEVKTKEDRDKVLSLIEVVIGELRILREERDPGKLFLSEVVEKEQPEFTNNNLILSPVGSGKTTFAESLIKENDHVLFLVSTTSLKRSLVPNDEDKRRSNADRTYTSKHKSVYGKGSHKIMISSYHEFGERIKYVDDFAKQFDLIICDEVHSLPLYQSYDDSSSLLVAMRYLFSHHDNQPKYYFTATDEYIKKLKNESDEILRSVKTFNYLDYPNIMKYTPLSSYEMTSIEQSRAHLRARKQSFDYFGYKVFAFCKTIQAQKRLKEICEDEGFTAQAYWSENNEENEMTEEQIKEAREIIDTGILPDKYDVIIINSAMQEGWNLYDKRVKLAIMNTTNHTEYVQALGRLRRDLDVLVYRVNSKKELDNYLSVPKEYLDKRLTTDDKNKLCTDLNIYNDRGRLYKWRTISKMLKKQGFLITDELTTIDGKRVRTSVIHSR